MNNATTTTETSNATTTTTGMSNNTENTENKLIVDILRDLSIENGLIYLLVIVCAISILASILYYVKFVRNKRFGRNIRFK